MRFHRIHTLAFVLCMLFAVFCSAPSLQAIAPENAPLTRAEAILLLVGSDPLLLQRRDAFAANIPPISIYYDVGQDSLLAPSIEVAFEAGVLQGNMFSRNFRPFAPLLGGEAVVLLARMLARGDATTLSTFSTNAPGDAYYTSSLRYLASRGYMLPEQWTPVVAVDRTLLVAMFGNAGIALQSSATETSFANNAPAISSQPEPPVAMHVPVVQAGGVLTRPPVTIATVIHAPQPQALQAAGQESRFLLSLPSIGISDLAVIHPADPFTDKGLLDPLKDGVGHLFSYPGNGGKILIYGHSSGYPWDVSQYTKIFRQINRLQIGDTVTVQYGGRTYQYQVTIKETVPAGDLSAYQDGGDGEELILYTCWPPDSISQRYLVRARPV